MLTALSLFKNNRVLRWLTDMPLDLLLLLTVGIGTMQTSLMLMLPWPDFHSGTFVVCVLLACFAGWRYEQEGDVIRFVVLRLSPLLTIFAMLLGSSALCLHLYRQGLDLQLIGAVWTGITLLGWFYFGGIISRGPDD